MYPKGFGYTYTQKIQIQSECKRCQCVFKKQNEIAYSVSDLITPALKVRRANDVLNN